MRWATATRVKVRSECTAHDFMDAECNVVHSQRMNAFATSVTVNAEILTALPVDEPSSLYTVLDDLLQQSTFSTSSADSADSAHPLMKAAMFLRTIKEIAQVSETDTGTLHCIILIVRLLGV
jgi:hypothetical protein